MMKHEDEIQDKIVLYNELLDVLKLIYFVALNKMVKQQKIDKAFRVKEITEEMPLDEALEMMEQRCKKIDMGLKKDYDKVTKEEIWVEKDDDEEPIVEGYTIDVKYIKQAWAKFRPVQDEDAEVQKEKPEVVKDIKKIFPPRFEAKLLSNLNLKIYMDSQSEEQKARKKNYKLFKKHYATKYANILEKERGPEAEDEDEGDREDPDEKALETVPEGETQKV